MAVLSFCNLRRYLFYPEKLTADNMKYILSVKNNISYILFIEDCVIITVTNHAEVSIYDD